MLDKKLRKVTVELNPVQMVWLHSQHLFQKIEQGISLPSGQIKFYKNNNGVQIRMQGGQVNEKQLQRAKQQLLNIINDNEIRLVNTSLHQDLYIRISKAVRKEFTKSYIIFLHYQTFQNCARKLQQKFNITYINAQLQKLKKINPNFCFLIAEKSKINDIEKFTNRLLHSQLSCASTTFSNKDGAASTYNNRRAMSVSSLHGSLSDRNQQQYRLSINPSPVQQQLFEMSESIIVKLTEDHMNRVKQKFLYEGCHVNVEKHEGSYLFVTKKLYYANRLQLTANPYMQPIYAYSMIQSKPHHWQLTLVTDKKYRRLSQIQTSQWLINYRNKIQIIIKVGKGMLLLHSNCQTYSGLNYDTILLDDNNSIVLSSVICKQIPPHVQFCVVRQMQYDTIQDGFQF